jgi:hypothetical protein
MFLLLTYLNFSFSNLQLLFAPWNSLSTELVYKEVEFLTLYVIRDSTPIANEDKIRNLRMNSKAKFSPSPEYANTQETNLWWILRSNWSLAFLSTWGERSTVKRSIRLGKKICFSINGKKARNFLDMIKTNLLE